MDTDFLDNQREVEHFRNETDRVNSGDIDSWNTRTSPSSVCEGTAP